MKMNMNNIAAKLSQGDSVGRVFVDDNIVYRGINIESERNVTTLLQSGLIEELVTKGMFPATKVSLHSIEGFSMVIEHSKIKVTTYPFEWSPTMLKSAAQLVLKINSIANSYGYELKDAHPYNVMFEHGRPIFIDLGSFAPVADNGLSWPALTQFETTFMLPLRLHSRGFKSIFKIIYLSAAAYTSRTELKIMESPILRFLGIKNLSRLVRLSSWLGTPKEVAFDILLKKNKGVFISKIFKFIWLSGFFMRRKSAEKLSKKLDKLNLYAGSVWGCYHKDSQFYSSSGEIKLPERLKIIADEIINLKPSSILEIAGNQGVFSRYLAQTNIFNSVICTDYDSDAIDYLHNVSEKNDKLAYLCFDFMGEEWQLIAQERPSRLKSDLVVALAVTHHLTLTQGYSIDAIIDVMSAYTKKYLIVEFMPLGLWAGGELPEVPDWYNENWFLRGFSKQFSLLKRIELEPNRIAYIGELKI